MKNEELMKEFMPEWYSENSYCSAGATGDGHIWALELGAQMTGYGCGGVWRTEDGKNGYHEEGGMAPAVSFFLVNIDGERFCNEYMGSDKNQLINEQPDKKAYCFMDSTSAYVALAEQGVEHGYTYKADTLEELCDVYGINKENLLQTVADYNECKATGGQDPFGVPTDYMVSMSEPPYYLSLFDPSMIHQLPHGPCNRRILPDPGRRRPAHRRPVRRGRADHWQPVRRYQGRRALPQLRHLPGSRHLRRPLAVRHALGLFE